MRPTLQSIAHRASVSTSAVSIALNNKPGISQSTREKIIDIARQLKYPIPMIQTQQAIVRMVHITKHGHILNEAHHPFISGYIEGIERICAREQMRLEIVYCDMAKCETMLTALEHDGIAGAIVLATELEREDLQGFQNISIPLCMIDANYDYQPFSFVDIDNGLCTYTIIKHLVEMGHREIGMVTSTYPSPNFKEREQSFMQLMERFELPTTQDHIFKVDSTRNATFVDFKDKLARLNTMPTALFCANDVIAYGVIKALQTMGCDVPGDVSIIGFDDLPGSQICTPTLSTLKVEKNQIGERAAQLLVKRIVSGIDGVCERIKISGTLIRRESVRDLRVL